MSELSIRDAAREAPGAPAIVTKMRTWTFAECAEIAAMPQASIVAEPAVGTLLAIYGALEARRPLALLHARATEAERERQRAALAGARLPDGAAIVLFTSGSTGQARGVVLGRGALEAAARAHERSLGWRDDDRWLLCLPLAHAGGVAIAIRCLAGRRPVVLAEGDVAPADVAALARATRPTLASLVPTQLAALLDAGGDALAGLRAVLLGGAAAPPALVEAALARSVPVLATYGLTETFGQVATAARPGAPLVALPGVELVAGTPDAPAPIRIRTPTLATCYLDGAPIGSPHRDPMLRDPAEPGLAIAPELTTHDLGVLDGGELRVLGRADDVIITGGENVHPAQVEAVLAATPGVRAACVFGVSDARWGQIVGAALAVAPPFDRAAALAWWHAQLAPHARPRRLALAAVLPLLPSGKVDRRASAALGAEPVAYPSSDEA